MNNLRSVPGRFLASPLSRQYLTWILIFGSIISVVLTSVDLYNHYVVLRQNLISNLNRVSKNYVEGLSRSLWEYNVLQAQLIINGMAVDDRIQAVELKSDILNISSGDLPKEPSVIKSNVIVGIEAHGSYNHLGDLVLYANLGWATSQVYQRAGSILLANFIKFTCLLLFGFFAFQILVNKQLRVICRYILSGKTLKKNAEKLQLQRNNLAYSGADEIDDIVTAINQLSTKLQQHIDREVTLVREAEEVHRRLAEAMRMESLGRQVSSITHEFNNSLAIILASINLISTGEELPKKVLERLAIAETSARNASQLTRQLLRYSGKLSEPEKTISLNLPAFKSDLEDMLSVLIGGGNKLVVRCETTGQIDINQEMLLFSIINLVKNADEAMNGNGSIFVIIRDVHEQEKLRKYLEPGQSYVAFDVIDNGPGVPVSERDLLFKPFSTTKSGTGGTGLGLWTIGRFVQQLGGRVFYQNVASGGSHFTMFLPVDPELAKSVEVNYIEHAEQKSNVVAP